MRTAVNPPLSASEYNLGAFDYTLAHEALRSRDYFNLFAPQSRGNRWLTLDNGADELGEGLQGDVYLDLIYDLKPQEVIAPDVLGNGPETVQRTKEFLQSNLPWDQMSVMGVAQGQTKSEFMESYQWML